MNQSSVDTTSAVAIPDGMPDVALSIRQPWAWAIVSGLRDVENRSWSPNNMAINFRGWVAIHAASPMTESDYEAAAKFIEYVSGRQAPPPALLPRGAIVGWAHVVDVATSHGSRWFTGPYAAIFANPKPCHPIPAAGGANLFRWVHKPHVDKLEAPYSWMYKWEPELVARAGRSY